MLRLSCERGWGSQVGRRVSRGYLENFDFRPGGGGSQMLVRLSWSTSRCVCAAWVYMCRVV
jgi:hypothetical protein